jgi:hypothetical protein
MGHLLIAIALNAVPLVGVWKFGWSVATVLLLFWLESLLGHLATMIKIRRHAALTHRRGHYCYSAVDGREGAGSYLAHFRSIAMIFTLAHGFFLGTILFMLAVNRPDVTMAQVGWNDVRNGAIVIVLLVLVDLAIDLPGLGRRSFLWMEMVAGKRLARVLVMHLTLIFGFGAMALFESPITMLLVFLGLKTLLDAASGMARDDMPIDAGYSDRPPALLRLLARGKKPTGPGGSEETIEQYWARGKREMIARRQRHEEVLDARELAKFER